MPRPMRPAPRQAIGSRALMRSPARSSSCSARAVEVAETQGGKRAAGLHEILAADRRADGEERPRQRRRDAGERRDRDEEGQPDARILQHVAMLREHDVLAPVAGIGQPVVRAAAVHPFLAFAGVVVGERKVRRAVAQRLAHRDALAVERIGDAPDRRLRALLVDVPALEMLERPGIHDDQRRMDDRAGIHQRGRERVAAVLDHAGKRAPAAARAHAPCARAETRRSAAAWRAS